MKKHYSEPEILLIRTSTEDILTASDEDVFVDGGDLFD
jgi:hypothetical protein